MKVKDLLEMEIDVDVYDDVCEELAIAFCGPLALSEDGKSRFAEVLDLPVTLNTGMGVCCVSVDDPDDKTWKRRLRKAKEFFEAAAGYCAEADYCRWFAPADVG